MVTAPGDFLVRESERKAGTYVLTANVRGKASHFIIQKDEYMQYRFEGVAFPDVVLLVQHYVRNNLAVTDRSQAKIKNPVFRPGFTPKEEDFAGFAMPNACELRHDQVQLGKKLGKGNFGDVCLGTLVETRQKVAVKTCRDTVTDTSRFLEEADTLRDYDHPNIVRLIGVVSTDPIYIVLELCGG